MYGPKDGTGSASSKIGGHVQGAAASVKHFYQAVRCLIKGVGKIAVIEGIALEC